MSDFNVAVIVLDTLREDYSIGLGMRLKELGFISYKDCISPAPWTGPSHISMFTGLMPSVHGIHESKEILDGITYLSREKLPLMKENVLRLLGKKGISVYGLSCNPMVSPDYGYHFDYYKRFNRYGDVTGLHYSGGSRRYVLRGARALAIQGKFYLAAVILARGFEIDRTIGTVLGTHPLEKGSRSCLGALGHMRLQEPFFLFVNLMECHEPYGWDRFRDIIADSQYSSAVGRPMTFECNWRERYPSHVALAVNRIIKILMRLKPYFDNTMIIVTSDHGQSLGESQRCGHGFFLEDELLRVPFYVRYPEGMKPFARTGTYLNLTSVHALIQNAFEGDLTSIGADVGLSESFGPTKDIGKLVRGEKELEAFNNSFAHRIRIYAGTGTGVYNKTTDKLESSTRNLTIDDARAFTDELPVFKEGRGSAGPVESLTKEEERVIQEHLRDLGYL